jgi:hypothetical protein
MSNMNNGWPGYMRGPIAARAALAAALLETIAADFAHHGKEAVEALRKERPHDYVKLVAALLPKDIQSEHSSIEDMSDDEFAGVLAAVRSLVGTTDAAQSETAGAAADETCTSPR